MFLMCHGLVNGKMTGVEMNSDLKVDFSSSVLKDEGAKWGSAAVVVPRVCVCIRLCVNIIFPISSWGIEFLNRLAK